MAVIIFARSARTPNPHTFTAPEGVVLDDPGMPRFTAVASELGLSRTDVQRLVDMAAEVEIQRAAAERRRWRQNDKRAEKQRAQDIAAGRAALWDVDDHLSDDEWTAQLLASVDDRIGASPVYRALEVRAQHSPLIEETR